MLSCAECRIGRLQATQATYLQPLRTQILVFPHAPASRCDVCGALAFDTFFTDMMDALIADHLEDEPGNYRYKVIWSYKIIYEITKEAIYILDVFHTSRDPSNIKK